MSEGATTLEGRCPWLWSQRRSYGVSRLSSLTRLDRLGIPVAAAMREDPLGESVSVCNGKGDDEQEAMCRALAEAYERYCAEPRGRIPLRRCAAERLDEDFLSPEALLLSDGATFSLGQECEWSKGWRIEDRRSIWLPANAVLFPYDSPPFFAPTTNGLAAGSCLQDALLHGLLECIERDALSRGLLAAALEQEERCPAFPPETMSPEVQQVVAAIRAAGLEVQLRDLSHDLGVPVVHCTLWEPHPFASDIFAHSGCAARLCAQTATLHAIQEAAQSRLADIQGAREDLPERRHSAPVSPWFLSTASLSEGPPNAAQMPDEDGLSYVLRQLREVRIFPCAIELSFEGSPIKVVRVLAPGLEVCCIDPTRMGQRARRWIG